MCLLAFVPAGQSIPYEYLEEAAKSNYDGAGVCYSDGSSLITSKGENWGAPEVATFLERAKGYPAIVHFRLSSCEKINYENTHPFPVGNEWSMAHNGVISEIECQENESDTRSYIRQYLKGDMDFSDEEFLDIIGKHVGGNNKFAFLHKSGKHGIVNEHSGHWHKGIWYSNYGYMTYLPKFYSSYSDNIEIDVADLSCQYCHEHVNEMAFGRSIQINSSGKVTCSACACALIEF